MQWDEALLISFASWLASWLLYARLTANSSIAGTNPHEPTHGAFASDNSCLGFGPRCFDLLLCSRNRTTHPRHQGEAVGEGPTDGSMLKSTFSCHGFEVG